MSVATEITRLQGAKNDLKTSINAKTDDSHQITNETIDEYADFVDSIETGGGDISAYFETEPTTPISDTYQWTTRFFIKKVPDIIINSTTSPSISLASFCREYKLTKVPKIIMTGPYVNSFNLMYEGCSNATEIDITGLQTSRVLNFSNMFHNCSSVTNIIGLNNIVTTSATDLSSLLSGCSKLTNIDLSNININAGNISSMFSGCNNLVITNYQNKGTANVTNVSNLFTANYVMEEFDLTNWNLNRCTSANSVQNLFDNCRALKTIRMPLSFNKASGAYRIATNCYVLTKLFLPADVLYTYNNTLQNCYHMNGTRNTTYNPQGLRDGLIYVPNSRLASYKTATGWKDFANQFIGMATGLELGGVGTTLPSVPPRNYIECSYLEIDGEEYTQDDIEIDYDVYKAKCEEYVELSPTTFSFVDDGESTYWTEESLSGEPCDLADWGITLLTAEPTAEGYIVTTPVSIAGTGWFKDEDLTISAPQVTSDTDTYYYKENA